MPKIHFDHFYRYPELTQLLQEYAQEYPNLVHLESIGKSYEGRDIWLLTVTNQTTGPDGEKPGFWVDANIHASEVSGSAACLYHLHTLLTQYGQDETITRCLDRRVFYLVPRLNPDGAEWALAERPRLIRSSTRPYPYDEDPVEGLLNEDIDGDGRLLLMRLPDPNGTWKKHPVEARLMVRRDPIETGGEYYRLLPEGRLENYDGVTIKIQPPKQRLDLNRNFPMEWRQENEQRGAGVYPTSEPEVRAMVDFIVCHPNLTGMLTFHTMSGALLRPYASRADEAFPVEDLWTYQKVGAKGSEITGYPNVSIFHDFRYHPKQVLTGGSDWAYEYQGMFYWAVELWSPQRQAGIKEYKFIDWYREHPVEDDLALLKWSDEALGGKGYVDWYPYEHPQLGKIELGGWDGLHYWSNVPLDKLENEIKPFPQWLVWQALLAPELVLHSASATSLGDGAYRVRLVVENCGWLPSYVTKKALEKKVVRGVICEIELPEEAVLETGMTRQEFGQLEGRAYKWARVDSDSEGTDERLKIEWVLRARPGQVVKLLARHERSGVVRAEIPLE